MGLPDMMMRWTVATCRTSHSRDARTSPWNESHLGHHSHAEQSVLEEGKLKTGEQRGAGVQGGGNPPTCLQTRVISASGLRILCPSSSTT